MKTVLLIEDNEQNSYLATFLLEKNGYNITRAADGLKALDIVKSAKFSFILLDIQLPTMDGYSVARALRKIDSLANIPIIAVTSYAMVGDKEKAVSAGCNGYIEKPIDTDTFIASIEYIVHTFETKRGLL